MNQGRSAALVHQTALDGLKQRKVGGKRTLGFYNYLEGN
jgi:hypothetical protein